MRYRVSFLEIYVFPLAGRPTNTITVGELVMCEAHEHFFSLTLGSVFLCSFELSMIFHMQFDDVVRGQKRSAEVSLPYT